MKYIRTESTETTLGRKLTDWEWRYYIIESYRKREAEHQQQIVRQWYQRLADLKVIHDFVWVEGRG